LSLVASGSDLGGVLGVRYVGNVLSLSDLVHVRILFRRPPAARFRRCPLRA
jgi:hypothetical protein